MKSRKHCLSPLTVSSHSPFYCLITTRIWTCFWVFSAVIWFFRSCSAFTETSSRKIFSSPNTKSSNSVTSGSPGFSVSFKQELIYYWRRHLLNTDVCSSCIQRRWPCISRLRSLTSLWFWCAAAKVLLKGSVDVSSLHQKLISHFSFFQPQNHK